MDIGGIDGIDVIGDVHGYGERLESLLAVLGYEHRAGAWRHPSRKAAFVGDIVDRGPQQLLSVRIVREMVDAGTAVCTVGNHELNNLGFATPKKGGGHYRPRTPSNTRQASAFIAATGLDTPLHREIVGWFRTLPLFVDFGDARIVHACWDPVSVRFLKSGRLSDVSLQDAFRYDDGTPIGATRAIEVLVKGPETDLPPGMTYADAEGTVRSRCRYAWWSDVQNLGSMALADEAARRKLSVLPADRSLLPGPDEPLTFIGHYWLKGEPTPLSAKVVCTDWSVAAGGPLVAYRWNIDERHAMPGRFVGV